LNVVDPVSVGNGGGGNGEEDVLEADVVEKEAVVEVPWRVVVWMARSGGGGTAKRAAVSITVLCAVAFPTSQSRAKL
jgi:hypothetical protein